MNENPHQTVVLLLGSNLEEKEKNLNAACLELENNRLKIIKKSSVYESEPWGMSTSFSFLNQAVIIETALKPKDLLKRIKSIERKMGRIQTNTPEDRHIDIDIIFYGLEIVEEKNLTIPHLLMHERRFVLVPLAEMIPDFIHPVKKVSIADLLKQCNDGSSVKKHMII